MLQKLNLNKKLIRHAVLVELLIFQRNSSCAVLILLKSMALAKSSEMFYGHFCLLRLIFFFSGFVYIIYTSLDTGMLLLQGTQIRV